MQRKFLLPLISACLGALLYSCHTDKEVVAPNSSHNQQFINNVSVTHRNTTAANSKPTTKVQPYQPVKHTPISAADAEGIKKRYAALLSVKPKDLDDIYLYKFIDGWYGLNYKYGGTRRTGIDCSAFAQRLYSEVYGINLVRTAMEQFGKCQQVKPGAAREGDLVFFSINSRHVTHVGVYLTNNFFVHSSTSGGVAISNLKDDYWHKYYTCTGRIPRG